MPFEKYGIVDKIQASSPEESKSLLTHQYDGYSNGDRQEASAPSTHGETRKRKRPISEDMPITSKKVLRELLTTLSQDQLQALATASRKLVSQDLRLNSLCRDATMTSTSREINLTNRYGPDFQGLLAGTLKMAQSFRENCLDTEQRKLLDSYHSASSNANKSIESAKYLKDMRGTLGHRLLNMKSSIYLAKNTDYIINLVSKNYPDMLPQVQTWLDKCYPKPGEGTSSQQPDKLNYSLIAPHITLLAQQLENMQTSDVSYAEEFPSPFNAARDRARDHIAKLRCGSQTTITLENIAVMLQAQGHKHASDILRQHAGQFEQ